MTFEEAHARVQETLNARIKSINEALPVYESPSGPIRLRTRSCNENK
jgi:hypothetical protein